MDAVAYVRVSSRSQDVGGQRVAIARAAKARGDKLVDWYIEKRNASTLQREELTKLRADAQAGKVAKIYVFRIDRLTRSGIRDTLAVVDEFRAHGCQIASVADGFALDGPTSDVVLAVLAWAAQMERQALGDRIAAKREQVEASGGRWGRPRAIDPGTLGKAKEMQRDGKSLRAIAVALKIPRSTLHRALSQKGHYSGASPGVKKAPLARSSR